MRTIYKIFIACILTAIVTAFTTAYIIKQHYEYTEETQYLCKDNASPDLNGCCPGETYTDMGDQGFNCCPIDGGDCFPPIEN